MSETRFLAKPPKVGNGFAPDIYPGLSRVPLTNPRRIGEYSSIVFASADLVALYLETGDLFQVLNIDTGRVVYPPKVKESFNEGRRASTQVYFIQASTGEIKIGSAVNVSERLRSLQTANPTKLALLAETTGGLPAEMEYHRCFAPHRRHGEWFSPHPDILAEIDRLNALKEPQ